MIHLINLLPGLEENETKQDSCSLTASIPGKIESWIMESEIQNMLMTLKKTFEFGANFICSRAK